jgi:hypothetical protein
MGPIELFILILANVAAVIYYFAVGTPSTYGALKWMAYATAGCLVLSAVAR